MSDFETIRADFLAQEAIDIQDEIADQVFHWAVENAADFKELSKIIRHDTAGMAKLSVTKAKQMGRQKGMPDLELPLRRGQYAGLWIVIKTLEGRLSAYRKEWIEFLRAEGYRVIICFDIDGARLSILDYINGMAGGGWIERR